MDSQTPKALPTEKQSTQTARSTISDSQSGKSSDESAETIIRDAAFSPCGKYRYWLTRRWSDGALLGIIGKNPSKADAKRDDQTIVKEIALTKFLGYGGFLKLNAYDLIATDSNELIHVTETVACSDMNRADAIIASLLIYGVKDVLCVWGTHSNRYLAERVRNRGEMLRRRLRDAGFAMLCLGRNSDGTPKHPLYLSPKTRPIPY